MFDNIGTLVAVGTKAGLFDETHRIPRIRQILFADASAMIAGSLLGTSTVVSYIESAAGVVAGGRSGVTAIVTGLLFIVAMFVGSADQEPYRLLPPGPLRLHSRRIPDDVADWRDRNLVAIQPFSVPAPF